MDSRKVIKRAGEKVKMQNAKCKMENEKERNGE